MWLWYADRATALVAFAGLWFATFAGILHNARGFGALHRGARRIHVPGSVLACVALLAHVALGTVDAVLVAAGAVPHPAYSDSWMLGGAIVGVSALLLLVTAVLGFLDAKSFKRPWDPRTVHALAYGGFAFAAIHAVALGSDMGAFARTGIVAGVAFLVIVLVLRRFEDKLAPLPEESVAPP